MKVIALCHDCAHQHPIDFDPVVGPGAAFGDWLTKHPHHRVDFRWPGRSRKGRKPKLGTYSDYLPNADVKVSYVASAAYTLTGTSLATSSTLIAGRESTAVSNASNKYLDYLIAGITKLGTSPSAGRVELWVYQARNDTPTYDTPFTGSDAAASFIDANFKAGLARLGGFVLTDATSARVVPIGTFSLAALYGGMFVPTHHGLWLTHNTAVNLSSTAGDHVFNHTAAYATVV